MGAADEETASSAGDGDWATGQTRRQSTTSQIEQVEMLLQSDANTYVIATQALLAAHGTPKATLWLASDGSIIPSLLPVKGVHFIIESLYYGLLVQNSFQNSSSSLVYADGMPLRPSLI